MLETFNLTELGAFHTVISIIAVIAGLVALFRYGAITTTNYPGLWYVSMTAATCVTGLFIFRHGGFGPPHMLAILTLVILALTYVLERVAGRSVAARYVIVLGNSLTLLFHLLPALNETGTRLPLGHPAFTGPDDPKLKAIFGLGFLIYVIGAIFQALRIRRASKAT
ncbi:MAG: hypothetical protein WDO12_11055 [Pseudomonadota bacterium]